MEQGGVDGQAPGQRAGATKQWRYRHACCDDMLATEQPALDPYAG